MMRKLKWSFLGVLCVLTFMHGLELNAQEVVSFPGAEGYGKIATGGRGGRVVKVTTLEDKDRFGMPVAGSFRAAVNTTGDDPIMILFEVSGTIELNGELRSGRSNMTIAGQSAPGDGICFKDAEVRFSGNNLILRYLRFRPGDEAGGTPGALGIENTQNIMIDHCSFSWAIEENMTFYDNINTTVQWCILSEGLYNSIHPKGARGYGSQWGGRFASYHHNILAHNKSRSPRLNGAYSNDASALVDHRNNLIFNWGSTGAVYGGEYALGDFHHINYVNNYYQPGPGTSSTRRFAAPSYARADVPSIGYADWYISGNYMQGITGGMNDDNWLGIDVGAVGSAANIKADSEFTVSTITTHSASEARTLILEQAGAILPKRDAVDTRIVGEIKGEVAVIGDGIIDSPSEVGGWPTLESRHPLTDTDGDGMPDAYESANSLNPNDSNDGKALSGSGYSNLEIYLNGLTGVTGIVLVNDITISSQSGVTSVVQGGTLQLSAAINPQDADDLSITWSSSDQSVATVSSAGLVTGVSQGSVTITVTASDVSGVSSTFDLTVVAPLKIDIDDDSDMVFPNPSIGLILFKSKKLIDRVEILDMQGKLLLTKKVNGVDDYFTDLSGIAPQSLIVRLTGRSGRWEKKIIKE